MASTSEVKTGLDEISALIRENREALKKVKTIGVNGSAALAGIAAAYADVLATIDGYPATSGAGADAFQLAAKAEKARLVTEFTAVKGILDQAAALVLPNT